MEDRRSLRDKLVVVTGGSAGVGRACSVRFARAGALVGVIARGQDGLDGTIKEIEALGGSAFAMSADVSDVDALRGAADEIERHFGTSVDVWVNNAMVSVFAPAWDISDSDFRRVTEVTYLGYVYGTKIALERMLPRDNGVIVQVGSALAYRAIPLQSAYCGAKHAIEGFTEALRCDLGDRRSNVAVTLVHMPALNTPQFHWVKTDLDNHPRPVPPIYEPDVAADAVVWAARHPRREVWVGWPTVRAILANRIAPGLLDWYLARTGVRAQQADWPIEAGRPDNLWSPVPGDQGAAGEFHGRASSLQLELTKRRRAMATLGAVPIVALATAAWRRWS